MPIKLLNPDGLDPAETHKHECDRWLKFTDKVGVTHTGRIFDRGYTLQNHPVYGMICEDNIERSVTEKNATLLPARSHSSP